MWRQWIELNKRTMKLKEKNEGVSAQITVAFKF